MKTICKGLDMKKILLIVAVFFGLINSSFADVNSKDAIKMVENLTKQGIEQIVNSTSPIEEKNRIFKKLFTENLDLDFIGKYVLGRYWRVATPQQKKEFINFLMK